MNDIFEAAAAGNLEYIKEHEKQIHAANDKGWTVLHFAARFGKLDIVQYLISQNVHLSATNANGKTAEQLAREWNHYEVARVIASKMTTNAHDNVFNENPLNRYSWFRSDKARLDTLLQSPKSKYVLFSDMDLLFDEHLQLYLASYDEVANIVHATEHPTLVFLGIDEREEKGMDGVPYWALDVTFKTDHQCSNSIEELVSGLKQRQLQFLSAMPHAFKLDSSTSAIVAQARSMVDWHTRNRFCSGCGRRTASTEGGHKRICPPLEDGTPSVCLSQTSVQNFTYPRTDPVIIVCIVHPTEDKVLLGRQKRWPAGFYTCVAGFVEAGESIEAAVRREAYEETGVQLTQIEYHSSQPWPFPNSLMFGFHAKAVTTTITLEDKELEDAKWFSRQQLIATLSGQKDAELKLPPSTAIAHRLIKSWATENRNAKI